MKVAKAPTAKARKRKAREVWLHILRDEVVNASLESWGHAEFDCDVGWRASEQGQKLCGATRILFREVLPKRKRGKK